MFESIMKFFKKLNKGEKTSSGNSKDAAKERLHLVLMQDRANVSADFLELMKQEIIDVIKKYIDIDESAIDVRLTNKENEDGTNGAPALYANIPIMNIKNEARKIESKQENDVKENIVKEETNSDENVNNEIKDDKSKNDEEKDSEEIKVAKNDKEKNNKENKEQIKEQQKMEINEEKQEEKPTESNEEKSEILEKSEKVEISEKTETEN